MRRNRGIHPISEGIFETRDGRPLSNNLERDFQAIVKKADGKRCTLHDLRRTFASHLAAADVNQEVVRQAAGHASAATTAEYYQRIPSSALKNAPRRLAYADSAEIVSYLSHGQKTGRIE